MNILALGDWSHSDFAEAIAGLGSSAQFCDLAAIDELNAVPELLVLAQSRRNQFLPTQAEKPLWKWPHAPAVHLLSSWCEGEIRSGKPLVGWTRVLWHRWQVEFGRFVQAKKENCPAPWDRVTEPPTAPPTSSGLLVGGKCLEIAVCSRWNSERQMIEEMLERFGHSCRRHDGIKPVDASPCAVDAWLIVADSFDAWLEACLGHLKHSARRVLKIVVMGFPRHDETERVQKLGGRHTVVLSKPFEIHQVQYLLQGFNARRMRTA